jgi:hypothetical protein
MRFDEASIKKRIQTFLEEIHTQADPEVLNRCRSIFRREVSFFRRSYMAAYLLLLAEQDTKHTGGKRRQLPSAKRGSNDPETPQRNRFPGTGSSAKQARSSEAPRSKNSPQEGRPPRERPQDEAPRVIIPEGESVRLFISIGRNRKVFPREILALINANVQVSRDDVGAIRILDNYSFVQVRNTAADAIIEALNGQSFRGRTLAVNYARSRREEDSPSTEDAAEETEEPQAEAEEASVVPGASPAEEGAD